MQVYTCNGTSAQNWTPEPNGTLQALGKCLDVTGGGTANGTLVDLNACNGTGAAGVAAAVQRVAGQPAVRAVPRRHRLLRHPRHPGSDLELHRGRQPTLDTAVTEAASPKDQTRHLERSRDFVRSAPP